MIEDLLQDLVDRLDHRYFGKYRGYVHRNDDPENLGRIQAVVPRLLGDTPTGWAMPCTPYAGPDQGLYTVPDTGTGVWIEFEGGDLTSPIWSGMWWGKTKAEDVGLADSTAREYKTTPEVPQHAYPRETAVPGVRMLKSATGHHVVLDDREGSERIEIHDSRGNRLILSKEGFMQLVSNERVANKGARGVQIAHDDRLRVGGDQTETISGKHERTVTRDVKLTYGGDFTESIQDGAFERRIDHEGLNVTIGGPKKEVIRGGEETRVAGASKTVASGGYGVTAGGAINIASGGPVNIAGTLPDPPSLNTVSIDALLGNISINTKLGICQLGGMTAISPMVLGDGLAVHLTMLAQILKLVNPLTAAAYGPALDAWAAMTPVLDLSYFGFVKRFPAG